VQAVRPDVIHSHASDQVKAELKVDSKLRAVGLNTSLLFHKSSNDKKIKVGHDFVSPYATGKAMALNNGHGVTMQSTTSANKAADLPLVKSNSRSM
jgi:hypothetical protein